LSTKKQKKVKEFDFSTLFNRMGSCMRQKPLLLHGIPKGQALAAPAPSYLKDNAFTGTS
jgi:hypothetical protein